MGKKTTLKDIASATGLSTMTVSNYLNGANVRRENARRIEEAVERLGYSANALARSLRSQRSMTVGALISYLNDPFSSTVLQGAERALAEHGYGLIVCDYNFDASLFTQRGLFLISKRVDGVLVIPPEEATDEDFRSLRASAPMVIIDYQNDDAPDDLVYGLNGEACERLARMAAKAGYTKLGVVAGRANSTTSQDCLRGCRAAEVPLMVEYGEYDAQGGYLAASKLLDARDAPRALIVFSYVMMAGTLRALRERGLAPGRDVSLLGRDMLYLRDAASPTLVSAEQNMEAMGKEAAGLLLRRMRGDWEGYPARVRLPLDILPGESLSKAAGVENGGGCR